jgi:serine/threonine protein phosphatase 1
VEHEMPLTYAIADLHGRYDLLLAAFEKITAHAHDCEHKVITLGDYIDRGPQSKQVIDHLMNAQKAGRPLICLKGNHEEIMRLTCRELPDVGWWLQNGGDHTLISYGFSRHGNMDITVVPEEHLGWVSALPLMHVDKHRVFVHAGVNPDVPLDEQHLLTDMQGNQQLIWKRYEREDQRGHGDRHVVHGHDPFEGGPILKEGRTDLDTLAWYTGRLVIGVFDDEKAGGPVELIAVRCKPHEDVA